MTDIKRIPSKTETKVKEELKEAPAVSMIPTNMTPEYIVGKLFDLHNIAHFYHFQTTSAPTHEALHTLYDKLVYLKDKIPEFLLGCQAPRRFEYITLSEIKSYSETELLNFLDTGCAFGRALCVYADNNNWEALEDMGGHVCEIFIHAKLMITYK